MQSNVPDYLTDISSQRITHWLIRQHLTKLSGESIRLCFDYLVTRMGETGLWKDLYDVAVLRCKWILAVRPTTGGWKDGQFGAINTIGETMEAMKDWSSAAAVYRDGSAIMENWEDEAKLKQHSGLALKWNGDYR